MVKVTTKAVKHSIFFPAALLFIAFSLTGCFQEDTSMTPILNAYYKPQYAAPEDLLKVNILPARALHDPGRIYLKGTILIINERFKGFHVIDNANPADPKPLLFVEVPGAVNMAMQDHYMYVDNMTDLVTLDLSNMNQIKEVSRQQDVFEGNQNYPPFTNVGFECVDSKKGVVVGWELAEMPAVAPACWR